MWCRSCRQDVPGIAEQGESRYGCPRCGAVLLNDAGIDLTADLESLRAAKSAAIETSTTPAAAAAAEQPVFETVRPAQPEPSRITTLRWDAANWELNEKLRHVERVTTVARRRYDAAPPTNVPPPHSGWTSPPQAASVPQHFQPVHYGPTVYPWPTAYAAPPHPSNPYAPAPYEPPHQPAAPQDDEPAYYERNVAHVGVGRLLASLVSWLFLGGAIMAFSCGGFLAAWGGINERPAVQQLGMPVVLLGMLSLVIGLLPQIFLRRLEERDGEQWIVRHGSPHESSTSYERSHARQMSRAPFTSARPNGR